RVVGVPDRLEVAERLDELGAEHHLVEVGARLTVAVLARQRAAVRYDEPRRERGEPRVARDTLFAVQIEVDPRVDAALAEVAVQRAVIAELIVERLEVAQVPRQRL